MFGWSPYFQLTQVKKECAKYVQVICKHVSHIICTWFIVFILMTNVCEICVNYMLHINYCKKDTHVKNIRMNICIYCADYVKHYAEVVWIMFDIEMALRKVCRANFHRRRWKFDLMVSRFSNSWNFSKILKVARSSNNVQILSGSKWWIFFKLSENDVLDVGKHSAKYLQHWAYIEFLRE